jgi:hypothetical protein
VGLRVADLICDRPQNRPRRGAWAAPASCRPCRTLTGDMAGSDTFRGCSFQAAFCVSLGLEVLQGAAEVLVVEGDEDIVDASLEDASGAARRIVQAKTKAEPYSWQP